MIFIIILLALTLVLLLIAYLMYNGLPEARTPAGSRLKWILLGSALCVLLSAGIATMILVQERTGEVVIAGLSAGADSDARQWLSKNAPQPPTQNQAGDNIRILREGISFINSHPKVGQTPAAQGVLQRYGTLPARPTRLLRPEEEQAYFEGAQAVYQLISSIAGSIPGSQSAS